MIYRHSNGDGSGQSRCGDAWREVGGYWLRQVPTGLWLTHTKEKLNRFLPKVSSNLRISTNIKLVREIQS